MTDLDVLVNMSQMTVSQMTPTSTAESHQQRLHWLAEHVIDWSPIPAVQIRPTVFLENPLFTILAARSIREQQVLALPFGSGRTSPIAAGDVADAVSCGVAQSGRTHRRRVRADRAAILDVDGLAAQYSSALGREISGQRLDFDEWRSELEDSGLDPHVQEHITTMARLHRKDRYNRSTDQVQALTGHAPQSVEDFVRAHRDLFANSGSSGVWAKTSHVAGVADPAVGNLYAGPHPCPTQQFAAGTDVGAVADDAVTDECPRADSRTEPDDRPLDHAAGLDTHTIEDDRAVQSGAGTDLGAASDDGAADEHRAG